MSLRGAHSARLLLHEPADGRWNMAVDEALLEAVGAGGPVVRLYGFSPATLSVGRFQRIRRRIDPQLLAREGVTLVRRPTGGQAVLHDDELTYAVILGRGHIEPFGKREVYRFIADLLLRGLRELGVPGRAAHGRSGSMHNPDCFRSTGEYEIADTAHRKLIGSAQILTRAGSLQHGAIPLSGAYKHISELMRTDPARPEREEPGRREPGSLSEALGAPLSFGDARAAFARSFAAAFRELGVSLVEDGMDAGEEARARELLEKRYERDEWNLMY